MAPNRFSQLQHCSLAWLVAEDQCLRSTMAAEHHALVQALGHDKGNLSTSLKSLKVKGLVRITRTPGGMAEAMGVTPTGRREVMNTAISS
jgi:hypothetical protein